MVKSHRVEFKPANLQDLITLYEENCLDEAWPRVISTKPLLTAWMEQWHMAKWLDSGEVNCLFYKNSPLPIGYCTLVCIDEVYCKSDIPVLEGGTFLTQEARGTGVNFEVKVQLRRVAKENYHASALVYTVLKSNGQALSAMRKPSLGMTEITSDNVTNSPWRTLWRRKTFEEGQEVHLFIDYF